MALMLRWVEGSLQTWTRNTALEVLFLRIKKHPKEEHKLLPLGDVIREAWGPLAAVVCQAHHNTAWVKWRVSEGGCGRLLHHHVPLAMLLQAFSFLRGSGTTSYEVL